MEKIPGGGGEQPASHEQDNDHRNQRFLFGPFVFNVDRAQEIVAEDYGRWTTCTSSRGPRTTAWPKPI